MPLSKLWLGRGNEQVSSGEPLSSLERFLCLLSLIACFLDDLTRNLRIQTFDDDEFEPTEKRAATFSSTIVTSFGFLSNLTLVSLPFPLLTNAIFEAIYDHLFIETLDISESIRKDTLSKQLNLHLRTSRPPRSLPLTLANVAAGLEPSDPALTRDSISSTQSGYPLLPSDFPPPSLPPLPTSPSLSSSISHVSNSSRSGRLSPLRSASWRVSYDRSRRSMSCSSESSG